LLELILSPVVYTRANACADARANGHWNLFDDEHRPHFTPNHSDWYWNQLSDAGKTLTPL